MTFYRKYRSQTIDELDLENIRESLKKLSSNIEDMPHAFLFAGPRGTGKTSSARILAKIVNCENPKEVKEDNFKYFEPCNKCDQCRTINNGSNIDVIEMDAASHRRIDDIRELRESVGLAPSNAKKKFYIIDEVHMLTTEAANAFLKTLEEPPSHVIFVLATTDPEMLPVTVRSRLTSFTFRKGNREELKREIERIVKAEKLKIDQKTVNQIITLSDGSFRDAAKYLEDIAMDVEISGMEVDMDALLNYLSDKDCKKLLNESRKFAENGNSEQYILDELIKRIREIIYSLNGIIEVDDYGFDQKSAVELLELFLTSKSQLRVSSDSFISLEIAFVKWCGTSKDNLDTKATKQVKKKKAKVSQSKDPQKLDDISWTKILSEMREKNASIEALLRAAKPISFEGNTFKLGVYYRFHKERLDNNILRQTLEDVCSDVLGVRPIKIECSLTEREESLPKKSDPPLQMIDENNIVQAAKEVFG